MPSIAEVRQKYPQYQDLSDNQLATALHKKYYSDMPYEDFSQKIGLQAAVPVDPTAKYKDMSVWDRIVADAGFMKDKTADLASAAVRPAVKAASALPLTAMDMGVSGRNMLTGSNYDMPSTEFNQGLDSITRAPTTTSGKVGEFLNTALLGMKLPVPEAAKQAPAGFVKPGFDAIRQQTLRNSQEAGYVVPPSTTNPNVANTFMESFGGKIATAQDAALKNQQVTNELAKRALGVTGEAPLAKETLSAVRREAGDAYKVMRSVGEVTLDDATSKTLDGIASKFSGSKLKEALGGGNDIPKIVQAIKDEPLTGDTAVDVISLLRDKAGTAYAQGSKEIGKAYKSLAETIENLMEKNLSGDALKNFRDARQLIAKTYSVESAFNPSTGNVVATKLASQLSKNKPLTGDLLTAAKFGQAFPKAGREMVDSGAVRNTDAILGSGAAVFTGHPWYLGWPFLRQGARSFLLSEAGQGMAAPSQAGIPPELAQLLVTGGAQSTR